MDEDTKQKLAAYFATQPVDGAYLFGSQTTGKANALSDVDVAVLFAEGISDGEHFDLRLSMASDVGRLSGFPDRAEVVDLEKVPLALQYSAVHPRQELFVRNRKRLAVFESEVMSRYFDYQYFIKTNTRVGLAAMAR